MKDNMYQICEYKGYILCILISVLKNKDNNIKFIVHETIK